MIPYYPEIEDILFKSGFEKSLDLLNLLREMKIMYAYSRTSASSENELKKILGEFQTDYYQGFLFTMRNNSSNKEIIHLIVKISKSELLRFIKLKVFS